MRRKEYLREILSSLEFQIVNFNNVGISYSDWTHHVFGYEINKVTDDEIKSIENRIKKIELKIGIKRVDVYRKNLIAPNQYPSEFNKYIGRVKSKLPSYILNFPDSGFIFETTSGKPWTSFNSHMAPYKSKLSLNTDIHFGKHDFSRLACHEAYGGHHSELSNKDQLLIREKRGEHGLVITYSPQVFVSEAIAEGVYILLEIIDSTNYEDLLTWNYDRLIFALQNLATFAFFDEHRTKTDIRKILSKYYVSPETIQIILNFSTDPIFGKYAPIYYSAFNFIKNLYQETNQKENLIKTLFLKPCTPKLLTEEFNS